MVQTHKLLSQLERIKKDFAIFRAKEDRPTKAGRHPDLYRILRQSCDLVRAVELQGAHDLRVVVDAVEEFIEAVVRFTIDEEEGLGSFVESYGHRGPPIEEMSDDLSDSEPSECAEEERSDLVKEKKQPGGTFSHGFLAQVSTLWKMLGPMTHSQLPRCPDGYDPSTKPHCASSPLARFKTFSGLSPTESTSLAKLLYEARFEATDVNTCQPIALHLTPGGSCLAFLSAGGWKNRDPMLSYFLLDRGAEDTVFPKEHSMQLPLSGIARHCVVHQERKLVFTADESRVKSFAWDDKSPVHTLDCSSPEANGPIALLSNRILRAGKGIVVTWDINELETHDPVSKKLIGEGVEFSTWRDEEGYIEPSAGNKCHTSIALEDKDFSVGKWHAHPSSPGLMIAGGDCDNSMTTACYAFDLETGKIETKYLGHGGLVTAFSTSASDPNVFLTGCVDGYVRLFDTRRSLPILTVDVSSRSEPCSSALLVHPDGVPTIFTGSEKAQNIKLWDVRARVPVYELATGNNAVTAMVWDDTCNALYAATECTYMDRMGDTYAADYRRANIPKRSKAVPSAQQAVGEHGESEEDDDDDEYAKYRWPRSAEHAENYFGVTFDAAEHRIYRFAFKADADPDVTPTWGGGY
ncbi:hypothetical protein HYDPIDRAFT_108669 [Hydnomerulius pinastri MD-312]|nr:hypothetical protein HYDPIDRAFT_108669 [Hydnomerulius pinastri MD-312]